MLKAEKNPVIPEALEHLDGIPREMIARLTSEQIELVKEVSRICDSLWEQDPEREAAWNETIMRACENGMM